MNSLCHGRERLDSRELREHASKLHARLKHASFHGVDGTPHDVCDLLTAAAAYSWVNAKPAWGTGYADLAANKIHVEVYLH